MKTAVVIPTYNEKENIGKLLQKIFELKIGDLDVIVIDDNSPDGTGDILEKIKESNKCLSVIHRKKKSGLGTAYRKGFNFALSRGAEYVLEMDADFSHDALLIPEFIRNMKDHDLVVGSRYISGGEIINWNFSRRMVSRFGNFYARMILNVPIKDLTTGYKCYRRKVVEEIIGGDINSVGYVFQVETTYKVHRKGFRIKEIPISFSERKLGKSKFNFKIIWESFWKVLMIRFSEK